jgi:hypothetical protein
MRRNPPSAFSVVGTLALGVAATTAIYTVVDGVLLKPLPFPDPDALVRVSSDDLSSSEQLRDEPAQRCSKHHDPKHPLAPPLFDHGHAIAIETVTPMGSAGARRRPR